MHEIKILIFIIGHVVFDNEIFLAKIIKKIVFVINCMNNKVLK